MPLKLTIRIFDEKGKLEYVQKGHSWTVAFLQCLCGAFMATLTQTVVDTGNTARALTPTSAGLLINSAAGLILKGIVVGYGTTANNPSQYALANIFANGNLINQLNYGAQTATEPIVAGSTITLTLTRQVTNGYAATQTINEIGIFGTLPAATVWYGCFARDKLNAGVDILSGATKTIQYTITETN